MTDREKAIQGLRELADFLEAHTAVPLSPHKFHEFTETREEWDAIRDGAPWTVTQTDDFFVLRKMCSGGIGLEVNIERPRESDESIPANVVPIG
jgi:hypothetical protein